MSPPRRPTLNPTDPARGPARGKVIPGFLLCAGLSLAPSLTMPVVAQDSGWNGARVMELVQRARDRRSRPVLDSTLRNYRAEVSGHIYFFIDREENPEPVLLRADQVALELYWAQPGQVKQVIQGMRSEEQFPIQDFRYYLDRYTVIQNGFDDVIRVGEGRDVRNVIHPLSAPGEHYYEFRLADSTIIRLPGEPEPIRVYEVKVRPRRFESPGIVGSLYLERQRGDLVRLAFTFTPASYVDPRNERVEVMLENALWEGRYWLPREQRLLVRRELPEFDIDVGTVIRAALTVDNYALNTEIPAELFEGREVTVAGSREALERYPFEDGLFDGLDDVGLAPGTDPGTLAEVDVDAIAGSIMRERFLRGIPEVRFYAPTGSDILRYDRSQGLVTGGGAVLGIARNELYGYAGYAWGSGDPVAEIGWQPAGRRRGRAGFARAYLNDPIGLGLRSTAAGVIASGSTVLGKDLRDVAVVSGVEVGMTAGDARIGRFRTAALVEMPPSATQAVRSAPFDSTSSYRPVPPVSPVARAMVRATYELRITAGPVEVRVTPGIDLGLAWDATPVSTVGDTWLFEDRSSGTFGRARLDGTVIWTDGDRNTGATLRATAGLNLGAVPHQHLWYLGGRNTLPGHDFHAFVGDRAAVVDATIWRTVVPRWLRLRAFAAAGWADLGVTAPVLQDASLMPWSPRPTDGIATSVGVGVATIDGLLRIDYGLRTDTWDGALILSIEPSLWSFL